MARIWPSPTTVGSPQLPMHHACVRRGVRVRSVQPYGVFVDVAPGMSGLVHATQLGIAKDASVAEHFSKDDVIAVKILDASDGDSKLRLARVTGSEGDAQEGGVVEEHALDKAASL